MHWQTEKQVFTGGKTLKDNCLFKLTQGHRDVQFERTHFFPLQNSASEVAHKMKQVSMCMWLLLMVGGQGRAGKDAGAEEKQKLSVKEYRLGSTERSALPPSRSKAQRQPEDFTISSSSFGGKKSQISIL